MPYAYSQRATTNNLLHLLETSLHQFYQRSRHNLSSNQWYSYVIKNQEIVHLHTGGLKPVNIFAIEIGYPIARVSSFASFSILASNRSANLFLHEALFAPLKCLHSPLLKAALAAATAASTSSGPATCKSEVTMESSTGYLTVRVSPDLDLTY